jgi:tetratricopeptide (TPR) repeat protein
MKKLSTLLLLSSFAFTQFNCTPSAVNENSNQTNTAPTTAPTIVAQTDQANSNVKPAETSVPTFTNADEALAEGKKLLDELETEKAVDALMQATKLNPDLAEAHFNLGIAYALVEKDEEEKAITQVETAPTPKPSRRQPKKNAPVVRTKNSEKAFENAVKAYKKFLVKNPKDDVAQFNLARAYDKLNEDEDALKAVKEAVKLNPDDYEYQTELGVILIKLAQYEEAVAALKKALKIDPTNLQAEDLLEKAEAGRKRVDFGNKPKPQPPQSQPEPARPRSNPKPKETTAPKEEPKPAPPNANQ